MDGKRYETRLNCQKMPVTKIFLSCRTTYPLYDPDNINNFLRRMNQFLYLLLLVVDGSLENKAVVCALSASYVSTFAGYPVSQHLVLFLCHISLNSYLARFHQVEITDDENEDNYL